MDQDKLNAALARLEYIKRKFPPATVYMGHSGGKDSAVILSLMNRVFGEHKFNIVHNVKPMLGTSDNPVDRLTEMHPDTLVYFYAYVCRNNKVTSMLSIHMPGWVREKGLLCQVDGARRSEATRAGKSSNIIVNGENVNRANMPEFVENGMFDISFSYPILDWEDDDVFDYLIENGITLSKEYEVNGELDAYKARKNG
jgi:3'-phosphoadenosine 5'-phosphosulfate sulfotransferase (PAPS reductase)/FAD synthetase